MSSKIAFNGNVLEKVAQAIVTNERITPREAKSIAKAALDSVKSSATPDHDAMEVKNAVRVAINYAARDGKSASAAKVLSQLEAHIEAARAERNEELAPKFTLAQNKKAALAIGTELAKRMSTDSNFPEMWRDGAFISIKGNKEGALVTYDYEFLAGGSGEYEEVEKFLAYIGKLIDTVPALKKWKGIEISSFGPDAT
ncbi:MAG: hypothetical protein HYV07_23440 [Deltaproteobacteria bacterium]|nr:hypothetical protein [Deltaproteobacteria bacterium]